MRLSLGRAVPAGAAALAAAGAVLAGMAAPAGAAAAAGGPGEAGPVIIVGLPGLRWTDLSATATPALWRLAGKGSAGSLVVSAVHTRSCPADGWLTLNSGARAAEDPSFSPGTGSARGGPAAPCPAMPLVNPAATTAPVSAPGGTPALIPAMRRIVSANKPLHYDPYWGLLARAAGPGGCATAAGPGAALALAGPGGHVGSYLPSAAAVTRQVLARCPLTVIDLGALPAAPAARAAALRAADAAVGRIAAEEPAGARLMVAGLADDTAPHLRAVIVTGPGYQAGRLAAASTRQPGMTLITDLTPTVLGWRGVAVPSTTVGSPVTAEPRGGTSLAAVVRGLTGQDTAAQVYRSTVLAFFLIYGFGEGVLFALIALLLRGTDPARRQRRRRAYTIAGVTAGAVPAATFLASLVPWWLLPHPAVLLYGLAAAWTAVIAVAALAGPWGRRPRGPIPEPRADQGAGTPPRPAGKAAAIAPIAERLAATATPPGGMRGLASRLGAPGQALGPPGVVAAVTVAVIGLDVMTGSRLQLGTPFGLSALEAGRFYGVGNNALGVYGASGLLLAAWVATALGAAGPEPEPGARRRAVLAVSAIALFVVVAAGWPGFGAKVGGTIAMVPGFLLLLAAVAGIRVTWRRALLILASGLVLVTGFAVLDYLVPSAGPSDIGAFVGHVLHGGSGGILQRKISANVGSLTTTVYSPIVPIVVVAAALILAWPHRFRLDGLSRAYAALPLLRPALAAMWLFAVLGWIADDSGVTVPAAAIPLALMLVIAVVAAVPEPIPAAGTSGDGSVKPLCREQQRRANL